MRYDTLRGLHSRNVCSVRKVMDSISEYPVRFFLVADVKYLMQAGHKLLNHPIYFVTILVVVTKELYSNPQPSLEKTSLCIRLRWGIRGCKNRILWMHVLLTILFEFISYKCLCVVYLLPIELLCKLYCWLWFVYGLYILTIREYFITIH